MRRLLLATIAFVTLSSVCIAQTGTSDRQGGQGEAGAKAKAPQPIQPGKVKPCGNDKSATSDRGGGQEQKSDSSKNNDSGNVKSGDC